MKVKINVTEEDIKNSIKQSACQCPTALALKRALNNDLYFVEVEDGNNGLFYRTPSGIMRANRPCKIIDEFIIKFDTGEEVQPYEVEVEFELEQLEEFDDD